MDFNSYSLGDIADFKYGKMPNKKLKELGGAFPIYTGYKISGSYPEYMYDDEVLIIVARGVGGTGDVKLAPSKSFITNLAIIIELNEEIASKKFMQFYLESLNLRYLDSGSAQSQITINDMKKLNISIPNISVQKRIADFVELFKSKIRINEKMIKNLESYSSALFKRWFIDFEFPNEQGLPYRSSGGEMVESELGEIPKRWEVKSLGEIFNLKRGYDLPTKSREIGEIPIVSSSGVTGFHNEAKVKGPGVITGRSGQLGNVFYVREDYFPLNTTLYIENFENNPPTYIYYLLKSLDLKSLNAGSSVPTLNRNHVHNINSIYPTKEILLKFDNIVQPIFTKIDALSNENKKLTELRDTLLPKLLSGEIEIPDESVVES